MYISQYCTVPVLGSFYIEYPSISKSEKLFEWMFENGELHVWITNSIYLILTPQKYRRYVHEPLRGSSAEGH